MVLLLEVKGQTSHPLGVGFLVEPTNEKHEDYKEQPFHVKPLRSFEAPLGLDQSISIWGSIPLVRLASYEECFQLFIAYGIEGIPF